MPGFGMVTVLPKPGEDGGLDVAFIHGGSYTRKSEGGVEELGQGHLVELRSESFVSCRKQNIES